MMEDAVHFLSKDTVVQAMSRSANKVCLFYILLLHKLFVLMLRTFLHFIRKQFQPLSSLLAY